VADDIAVNKARANRLLAEVTAPPALVVLVVVSLLAGPVLGLVAGVIVGAGIFVYVRRAGEPAVRAAIGGVPVDEARHPRLQNLVDGLSGANGVAGPELLVLDDPAPNALSFGLDARHATVAMTSGLLERLSRVELEGVVAREVARIKSEEIRPATIAVAVLRLVGTIPPWAAHVRRIAGAADRLVLADASGVRLTRYPPGLASALERIAPDASGVAASSPTIAHLWLEPPVPVTDLHPPLEERVEALREL
jgi:heat shock protein HtpX